MMFLRHPRALCLQVESHLNISWRAFAFYVGVYTHPKALLPLLGFVGALNLELYFCCRLGAATSVRGEQSRCWHLEFRLFHLFQYLDHRNRKQACQRPRSLYFGTLADYYYAWANLEEAEEEEYGTRIVCSNAPGLLP
jgi:hypothetical protein